MHSGGSEGTRFDRVLPSCEVDGRWGKGACRAACEAHLRDLLTRTLFSNRTNIFNNEEKLNFLLFRSGQNAPIEQNGMRVLPEHILGLMGSRRPRLPPLPHLRAVWEACSSVPVCKAQDHNRTSHTLLCPQEQNPLHIPRPTWARTLRIINNCTEPIFLPSLLGGILFYVLEISSWGNLLSPPLPFCFSVLKSRCCYLAQRS